MIKTEYRAINEIRRNKDDNRTTVVINSDALDRHGTVIVPDGVETKNYERNPVVLINHDRNRVAGTSSIRLQDGKLITEMNDDDWDKDDPDAMLWRGKVKKGIVRMASMGFNYNEKDVEEVEREDGTRFFRILKSELLEWSWVTIGSNPEALVQRNLEIETEINERLDKIEEKIGKLADRTFIQELIANSIPEKPVELKPIQDKPIRQTPVYDPAQISELVKKNINQILGKA